MQQLQITKTAKACLTWFSVLAILLLAATPVAAMPAPTSHTLIAPASTCGRWSIVTSPNPGSAGNTLSGVAAISASDAWAVGFTQQAGHASQVLIEQWNGTSWSIVPGPNPGHLANYLNAVTALSATDVWAVGSFRDASFVDQTLIEHWDGTSWQIVTSPKAPNLADAYLTAVAASSATDVWAVGFAYLLKTGFYHTLIEHWNGTTWQRVHSPSASGTLANYLYGVTAISQNDAWATGYQYTTANTYVTLTEQWNGHTWTVVPGPSSGSAADYLYGTASVPGTNGNQVWAVGNYGSAKGMAPQWNGSNWNWVYTPVPGSNSYLYGVTAVSTSDAWAVGKYNPSSFSFSVLIEHWDGLNWNIIAHTPQVGLNDSLAAVASVPGTRNVWAVGTYQGAKTSAKTLVEYYC